MNLGDKLFLWMAGERVTAERERQALQARMDEAEIAAFAWLLRLEHRERDLARFDTLQAAITPEWSKRIDAAVEAVR